MTKTNPAPAGIDVQPVTEWMDAAVRASGGAIEPPLSFVQIPGGRSNLTFQPLPKAFPNGTRSSRSMRVRWAVELATLTTTTPSEHVDDLALTRWKYSQPMPIEA